jgi:hypothetical protein
MNQNQVRLIFVSFHFPNIMYSHVHKKCLCSIVRAVTRERVRER